MEQRIRSTQVEVHGFIGRYPDFVRYGNPPCAEVDPELYFPDKGCSNTSPKDIAIAKKICKTCPYMAECLAWAVANDEIGIWGGTTQKDRRVLRRQRRLAS
jgi:WhiB family transcriptional regulator, redox-sensing transcriptional regulator